MAITQKQIAQHLGVSRIVVQRALSGHPYVDEGLRSQVLTAAKEMDYDSRSNGYARALVAQRYGQKVKHDVVAVLMPYGDTQPTGNTPFFMPLLSGIEWQAEQMGVDLYLGTANPSRRLPRLIRERGVDGVIYFSADSSILQQLKELELTTVSLAGGGDGGATHSVRAQGREGIRQAVEYLAKTGHQKIAFLGQDDDLYEAAERLQGYREGLKESGLPVREQLIEATLGGVVFGAQGMERLLARTRDFTAVVCYNDLIAMRAIRKLEDEGIRVPQDVSVVGFDDISVHHEFRPALTSIACDRFAMGKRAVEMLSETQDGSRNGNISDVSRRETFPVELIVRESTRKL